MSFTFKFNRSKPSFLQFEISIKACILAERGTVNYEFDLHGTSASVLLIFPLGDFIKSMYIFIQE